MPCMRTTSAVALLIVTALVGPVSSQDSPVNLPGWLTGLWIIDSGGSRVEEHWTSAVGGLMLGVSRTIKNDRVVAFEFLRIERRGDFLVYIAQPQGNPPTEFKLSSATADQLVFENPQHDFPKKILYRRNKDGSVTAEVSGDGEKKISFPYKRAKS
jgi:hypothetical protein